MLKALEGGVKGGVWFSLVDKVYSKENLEAACAKVCANRGGPGVDGVTVARFGRRQDAELARLHEQLCAGTYAPGPIRRAHLRAGLCRA